MSGAADPARLRGLAADARRLAAVEGQRLAAYERAHAALAAARSDVPLDLAPLTEPCLRALERLAAAADDAEALAERLEADEARRR